jgi:Group II intron, maturase-specific domain
MERRIAEINRFTVGWTAYFSLADTPWPFIELDGWLRRRLRQTRWKEWKRVRTRRRNLQALGMPDREAREWAGTKKGGYWRVARSALHRALPAAYWTEQDLKGSPTVVIFKYSKFLCFGFGQTEAIGGRTILLGVSGENAPIHELGHRLGLRHAVALGCEGPGGVPVPLSERCKSFESGDRYDMMGGGFGLGNKHGLFNALKLNALGGWLNGQVVNMSAPGPAQTVTLRPLSSESGTGPRAVQLVDGSTTLWIEYRQPTGLDASKPDDVVAGLLVHRELQNAGELPTSQLLDMSPPAKHLSESSSDDARLKVGYTWENPLGEMRITLNRATKTGATVTVSSRRVTDFSFGKLKRNKNMGTAIQVVKVPIPVVKAPGPGTLKLSGKGLFATVKRTIGGPQTLRIRARGGKQKTLNRKGRVTLRARFTYTPTGGDATTKVKTILLIKER